MSKNFRFRTFTSPCAFACGKRRLFKAETSQAKTTRVLVYYNRIRDKRKRARGRRDAFFKKFSVFSLKTRKFLEKRVDINAVARRRFTQTVSGGAFAVQRSTQRTLLMISIKASTFKEAPPTSAPSTSGLLRISFAFEPLTLPPY